MILLSYKYDNLFKAPLLGLFLLISCVSFGQTNEKTKEKEMKQVKEINKDYDRPAIKKKREDYLTQTRQQRLGTGKEKIKNKSRGQKEGDYIKKNAAQSSSSGDIKAKSKGKKETEYINKTSGQRAFKGDVKTGTPQEREYSRMKNDAGARSFSGREKAGSQGHLAKKDENKKTMSKNSSGDLKYQTRGEKESAYVDRTKGQRTFQGREKAGSQEHLAKREENKKIMQKYSSGDLKYQTKGQQEAAYIKRTAGQRSYQGNIKTGQLSHLQKRAEVKKEMESGKKLATPNDFEFLKQREQNKKDMEKYASGDLQYFTRGQKENAYVKRTAAMRSYQGNIDRGNLSHLIKRAEVKAEMEKYSTGDIAWRDLEKREKQRREKAKRMAAYSGSVLTKDLEKWRKSIRQKEKDIANFQGNIKIKKRKEGQHPSAAYKGGYIANSYTQKARMRKKNA